MIRGEFIVGLALAFAIGPAAWVCASPHDPRAPVPDGPSRAESARLISELFAPDRSRVSSPADEAALAAKLLKSGIETHDDPASRFVLFDEARTTAAQAGSPEIALQAVAQLSHDYRVDGLSLAESTLASLVASVSPQDSAHVLPFIDQFVNQAVRVDRYDLALEAAELGMESARKTRDPSLQDEADAFVKEMQALQSAFAAAAAASSKLAKNPADPDANLAVGRFHCLYKGDFSALASLARGSDPTLKYLALIDLANPKDAKQMVNIGDGWWDWSQSQTGAPRQIARRRSAFWYRKAEDAGLDGLSRMLIDHRLTEIESGHSPATQPLQPPP